MRLRNLLLPIFAVLALFIGPAHADTYLMVGGSLANISELDTDNIGYSGEAGWTNGTFAVGGEVSNHMHLGNETLAGAVNARVFLGDWVVRPYVSAGAGATFEGDPLAQAGVGLMWTANDEGEAGSFGIYAGYEHRFYFDGFDDFDSTGDDGYAKVGMMLTF
jgi:hypothetical protein